MDRRLTRLYVSGLSSKVESRDIEPLFQDIGKVTRFEIKDGRGFVEYDTPAEASSAIKKLDGQKVTGERMKVEYAMKNTNRFIKEKRESIRDDIAKGRCFKCKEKGHIAKNCTKDGHRRSGSSSRSRSSSRGRSGSRSPRKSHKRSNHGRHKDNSESKSRSRSRSKSGSRSRKDKKKSHKKDRKHKDKEKEKKREKDNHD